MNSRGNESDFMEDLLQDHFRLLISQVEDADAGHMEIGLLADWGYLPRCQVFAYPFFMFDKLSKKTTNSSP